MAAILGDGTTRPLTRGTIDRGGISFGPTRFLSEGASLTLTRRKSFFFSHDSR